MREHTTLLILTYEFPFGKGETYLETEIQYASKFFENVLILSVGHVDEKVRKLPENVRALHITRSYHFFECCGYGLFRLLKGDVIQEYKKNKKADKNVSIKELIKQCVKWNMLSKRYEFAIKELKINTRDTIGYSYWLNEGAYYLAQNHDRFKYTISRAHGYELRDNEVYMPFRSITDAGIDEISFISENAQRQYLRIMRMFGGSQPDLKRYVRYLGVKESQKATSDNCWNSLKKYTILSCSVIYQLKRLDLIIDALSLLPDQFPVRWVHFGWGVDGEKIQRYAFEKLSSKTNLEYEFKGWVSNTDVVEYYRQNQVLLFINVSNMEGIPVSIMEALSHGVPALARAVGGNPEIVVEGESGYLVSENAGPEEIADRLCGILRGTEIRYTREQIQAFFYSNFDADTNYTQFYEYLAHESDGRIDR